MEEVTDARSGSFTGLNTITRILTPSSFSLTQIIFSPFSLAIPQDQKSVAEEKVWSEIWLLDYFSQHGEDAWPWPCRQSVYILIEVSGDLFARSKTHALFSDQSTPGKVEPADLSGATEPRG